MIPPKWFNTNASGKTQDFFEEVENTWFCVTCNVHQARCRRGGGHYEKYQRLHRMPVPVP